MPHKRSAAKLEERLAKSYCYQNSKKAPQKINPEIIDQYTTKNSEDVSKAVLARIRELELSSGKTINREGEIPDYPQGLVISDSRGLGFFDLDFSR